MSVISSKYIVIDLKTNGSYVKISNLLSISFFKPDDETTFNASFSLESQTATNHIDALTQKEFNNIIDKFELETRTILIFDNFSREVLKNYLNRHNIIGFEKLKFQNIDEQIFYSRFDNDKVTLDNLCETFKIPTNTSNNEINNCISLRQLFDKIHDKRLLILNNQIYEFNDGYVIPLDYLYSYPKLKEQIKYLPQIFVYPEEIKRIRLSGFNVANLSSNTICKLIEESIKESFKEVIDLENVSSSFSKENESKLKHLGNLGSTSSSDLNDNDKDTSINPSNPSSFKKQIKIALKFIKKEVFAHSKTIYHKELVLDNEDNVYGKCDFSNENVVLQIKPYVLTRPSDITYELFYLANGRDSFLLELDFKNMPNTFDLVFSKVDFKKIGECEEIIRKEDDDKEALNKAMANILSKPYKTKDAIARGIILVVLLVFLAIYVFVRCFMW